MSIAHSIMVLIIFCVSDKHVLRKLTTFFLFFFLSLFCFSLAFSLFSRVLNVTRNVYNKIKWQRGRTEGVLSGKVEHLIEIKLELYLFCFFWLLACSLSSDYIQSCTCASKCSYGRMLAKKYKKYKKKLL